MRGLLLAALLGLGSARAQQPTQLDINDFSGGLNTYQSPLIIKPNQAQQALNVLFDKTGSVDKRQGSIRLNSTILGDGRSDVNSVYQLNQSNGTNYCVAFSSTTGSYSTDGCQTFTVFVTTLTRGNDVNCSPYNDNLFCANNQNTGFYFDGTYDRPTINEPASMKYLRVHRNRCFAAGGSGTPSRLFYSALGDCTSWTTATDYIDIATNDGDVITGIGPTFFDGLPIYKNYSTWYLKGVDNNSFVLANIDRTTGAKNHRTIQNLGQVQLFDSVGPNGGQPGVYGFNGIVVQEVSKNLRGELDQIDSFRSSTARKTIDTQADWAAATFSPKALSATRISGFMLSSDTAETDQFTNDWLGGTTSQIIVNASSNVTSGIAFRNGGFETGDFTNWTNTSFVLPSNTYNNPCTSALTFATGTYRACGCSANTSITSEIDILDGATSALISSAAYTDNSTTCKEATLPANGSAAATFKIKVTATSANEGTRTLTSTPFNAVTSVNYVHGSQEGIGGCGCIPATTTSEWDFPDPFFGKTSVFTSQCFDMSISTPVWGLFTVAETSSAINSVTFQTKVASACTSNAFDSAQTATPGNQIISKSKESIQYVATLTSAGSSQTAQINLVSLEAASTGYWRSNEIFLSKNIINNGWGLFQTVQTTSGNGAITYGIRVGVVPGAAVNNPVTALTPGSPIAYSTGAYVVVDATYTVVMATENSKTDSFTINWNEGSQATSASAVVFQNRYHYGAQSLGGNSNDTIYVVDMNGAWSKWTGINPRMLNVINQNFIMTESTGTGTQGYVDQLYTSDSDNGNAIDAIWQSKDYDFGNLLNLKSISAAYSVLKSNAGNITLDIIGDTGINDQQFLIPMSTGAIYGIKYEPTASTLNGRTFSLEFSNNAASIPWRLLRAGMIYVDLGFIQP